MSVDWNKPIEHIDGTPLVLYPGEQQNPDASGDYYLIREDGQPLTKEQCGNNYTVCMIVKSCGRIWGMGRRGSVVVRNRTPTTQPEPTPTKTLRDEFAMAALASFNNPYRPPIEDARRAYQIADAMMAARKEMGG